MRTVILHFEVIHNSTFCNIFRFGLPNTNSTHHFNIIVNMSIEIALILKNEKNTNRKMKQKQNCKYVGDELISVWLHLNYK